MNINDVEYKNRQSSGPLALGDFCFHKTYAVVTPLRKAASYEQRKTNLGSSP